MIIILLIQMRIKCKSNLIYKKKYINVFFNISEPQHSGISSSRCQEDEDSEDEDSDNQEAAHSDAENDDETNVINLIFKIQSFFFNFL